MSPVNVSVLIPFAIAAICAALLGVIEIFSIFKRGVSDIFRNRTGLLIVAISFLFGLIAYTLSRVVFGVSDDLLRACLIGLTFPAVLKSPITFLHTRQDIGNSDKTLTPVAFKSISKFYENLLNRAMDEADRIQADARSTKVEGLSHIMTIDQMISECELRIPDLNNKDECALKLKVALETRGERGRAIAVARVLMEVCPSDRIHQWLHVSPQ
jgi:hypothetical protein